MHFRAIDERPFAAPQPGAPWLLLGFAVLSLGVHALLLIPAKDDAQPAIVQLGTPYIRVTLTDKPQPAADKIRTENHAENHREHQAERQTERRTKNHPQKNTATRVNAVPVPLAKSPTENITKNMSATTPSATTAVTDTGKPRPAPSQAASTRPQHLEQRASNDSPTLPTTAQSPRQGTPAKQAPASQQTSRQQDTQQQEALRNYLLGELRDQLSRYLTYPQRARRRGWEGEVLLALDISSQGKLQNIQLVRSSGYAPLDRSAMQSLARVDKLRLPENGALQHSVNLHLPVIYRLRNP